MATFADIQKLKTTLIRKAKSGSGFLAPITAPVVDESFVGVGGVLAELPTDYFDLGWLSNDGMSFARDQSSSDVTSFGSVTPTRSDVTSDTETVTVVAQETKLDTIGLYTGVDTVSIKTPGANGAVMVRKPATPTTRHYRGFFISKDDGDFGDIYIARVMPRVKVTSFSEQAYGGGDDPISWGVTLTGYMDPDEGFATGYLFGGPGWNALLDDMGFDATNVTAAPVTP